MLASELAAAAPQTPHTPPQVVKGEYLDDSKWAWAISPVCIEHLRFLPI